jgi:hypothetical protein
MRRLGTAIGCAVAIGILAGAGSVQAMPLGEMKARTVEIATRYLAVWSSSNWASLEGVPYVYGPRVRFYGRNYSHADLIAEKSRFIRQWPVRHYAHRPGSMQVICNEAKQRCGVRSVIDFTAENPGRGTRKSGSAKFDLGISFEGPHPVILYEGGTIGHHQTS